MSWRGSTSPQDRAFACLPYLLPLIESLAFAAPFMSQFPVVGILFVPLMPIISLYGAIPFAGLIVFFALYMGVVRNENIAHFIRFNAMQAILIDIILVLCSLLFSVLAPGLGGGLIVETLYNVVFLGAIAAIVYSIIQSVLGRYAEIPTLSEAVYMQVR
jgi:Chloroplast import apparatus Tic20-like